MPLLSALLALLLAVPTPAAPTREPATTQSPPNIPAPDAAPTAASPQPEDPPPFPGYGLPRTPTPRLAQPEDRPPFPGYDRLRTPTPRPAQLEDRPPFPGYGRLRTPIPRLAQPEDPTPFPGYCPPPTPRRAQFDTPTPASGYRWPLTPRPAVLRGFEPPPAPWLPGHRGVDLAGTPDQPVLSAGPGTVHYSGVIAGVGVVSVAHPNGLLTTYQPVKSSVRAGTMVGAGTALGTLDPGHPGCGAPACLHWGLRRGRVYLDPLTLVGHGRVRLLPTAGRLGFQALTSTKEREPWSVPTRRRAQRSSGPCCGPSWSGGPARS
ncbi:peptidoglycan DD-metalloendopeptidase family protein [Longispora sp. NPDC051575]|uniref:M23 family metallopeptidase n=1 Tax=Longispora sp. NPDC051575 TaxID=3154943 RepID=UPI00342D26A7